MGSTSLLPKVSWIVWSWRRGGNTTWLIVKLKYLTLIQSLTEPPEVYLSCLLNLAWQKGFAKFMEIFSGMKFLEK